MAIVLLGILLGHAVTSSSGTRAFPSEVASGALPPAPGFDLPNLGGSGTTSLASLRGKVVVVNFWASWCDPCKDEAPILQDYWATEAQSAGVVVLGVDAQDIADDARAFARTYRLTYPLVHDDGSGVTRDYGVTGFPETFVVDAQGRAAAWFPGPVTLAGLRAAVAKAKASSS